MNELGHPRVLRVSHSAVVTAWRERDRALIRRGVRLTLFSAAAWPEGGQMVRFEATGDDFASGVRTFGRHPNVFVFDPRPLWRALRVGTWDLLDIHEEPCSLALGEVLALRWLRRTSTPVVCYSAQNIEKRYPPPFRWIENRALRAVAGVSVCNEAAGQILRGKGLRAGPTLIPLGVDIERFSPRPADPPGDQLTVGYFGRLDHHKGVHVLLDAIAAVPAARACIVGDGPERSRLVAQAERLGIGDRVHFAGAIGHDQLPDRYRACDVVAVPSIPTPRWDEQFCRVAVEAMASGVPVIASATGALPEVVGAAGLLVPPDDPGALAGAIRRLATDADLRKDLGHRSVAHAQAFTWDAVAERQLDLYRRALGCSSTGSGQRAGAASHRIEVVVVAYGAPDLLDECLRPVAGVLPITVVDNSSSAAVREVAARHGARYLDPGRNLGFGAGVNYAAAHSQHPEADLLLLNPDAVIQPDAVAALGAALAADAGLACVAPAQVDPTGIAARVGWPFPRPAGAWLEATGLGRLLPEKTEYLIGSVLLIRREALADIGGFDERFFLYAEETDWQRRATRAGWKVAIQPGIQATHVGAGTARDPAQRQRRFHAAHERYIRKHHGPEGWLVYRGAVVVGAALRAVVLRGERREDARERLRLYLSGPQRAEAAQRGAAR